MISVILTTYNGERYIVEQLDSIRNQTISPDEVLIYDDVSTDNTYDIVSNYLIEHHLVDKWKLYKNECNKGYAKNFHDAILTSKGDYIFLCDQDDIWFPKKIEKMVNIIGHNEDIELLASNVKPFYVGNDPRKVNYERYSPWRRVVRIKNKSKWIKPARPGCSMCFKRSLLQEFDDLWFEGYPHDSLLWGISVLRGKAYLFNENTIMFRRHDTNASSRQEHTNMNRIKKLKLELKISENMIEKNIHNENLDFLRVHNQFYKERIRCIEEHSLFGILKLVFKVKYYARFRYWMTDVYYCMNNTAYRMEVK